MYIFSATTPGQPERLQTQFWVQDGVIAGMVEKIWLSSEERLFPEISGHFGSERIPFLTELLDPDSADLVFRDLGNGVKGWVGQDTCPTL